MVAPLICLLGKESQRERERGRKGEGGGKRDRAKVEGDGRESRRGKIDETANTEATNDGGNGSPN